MKNKAPTITTFIVVFLALVFFASRGCEQSRTSARQTSPAQKQQVSPFYQSGYDMGYTHGKDHFLQNHDLPKRNFLEAGGMMNASRAGAQTTSDKDAFKSGYADGFASGYRDASQGSK